MTKQTTNVVPDRPAVTESAVPAITPPADRPLVRVHSRHCGRRLRHYVVAGLIVWPSNLSIDASDRGVVSLYAAHVGQATAQYLLVEGLAGLCLHWCCSLASVAQGGDLRWTVAGTAGGVAVMLSLLQGLLGLFLISSASEGHLGESAISMR